MCNSAVCVVRRFVNSPPFGFVKENIMKQFVILLAAVAMIGFVASESHAQCGGGGFGGSSFGFSTGGFNRGFGGGFYGGSVYRPVYRSSFSRGGFNRGFSYGRSGSFYGGGFRRGFRY